MYQLTVEAAHSVTVTDHPDHEAAHGQLMRHVVAGDYYLRTLKAGPAHSAYELLVLAADRRRPRSAGHAIIEELPRERALPVDGPERCAAAATRWIAHHRPTWEHGFDTHTDPRGREIDLIERREAELIVTPSAPTLATLIGRYALLSWWANAR